MIIIIIISKLPGNIALPSLSSRKRKVSSLAMQLNLVAVIVDTNFHVNYY